MRRRCASGRRIGRFGMKRELGLGSRTRARKKAAGEQNAYARGRALIRTTPFEAQRKFATAAQACTSRLWLRASRARCPCHFKPRFPRFPSCRVLAFSHVSPSSPGFLLPPFLLSAVCLGLSRLAFFPSSASRVLPQIFASRVADRFVLLRRECGHFARLPLSPVTPGCQSVALFFGATCRAAIAPCVSQPTEVDARPFASPCPNEPPRPRTRRSGG